jgi:hypothetical protein
MGESMSDSSFCHEVAMVKNANLSVTSCFQRSICLLRLHCLPTVLLKMNGHMSSLERDNT